MSHPFINGPYTFELEHLSRDLPGHVPLDAHHHYAFAQVVWLLEDDADCSGSSPQCEATTRLLSKSLEMYELLLQLKKSISFMTRNVEQPHPQTLQEAELCIEKIDALVKYMEGK